MGKTDTHVFRYGPASHLIFYEWLLPDGDEIQEHNLRYGTPSPFTPMYYVSYNFSIKWMMQISSK